MCDCVINHPECCSEPNPDDVQDHAAPYQFLCLCQRGLSHGGGFKSERDWHPAVCIRRSRSVCSTCIEHCTLVYWSKFKQQIDSVDCYGPTTRGACARPAADLSKHCLPYLPRMFAALQVLPVIPAQRQSTRAVSRSAVCATDLVWVAVFYDRSF